MKAAQEQELGMYQASEAVKSLSDTARENSDLSDSLARVSLDQKEQGKLLSSILANSNLVLKGIRSSYEIKAEVVPSAIRAAI